MKMSFGRSSAALLAITFLLTACGGGGGSQSSLPSTGASSAGKTNVSLSVTIPNSTVVSKTRRGAQTVSSQTASITVSVNNGTPQVFNVDSTICSGSPSLVCTLTVGAPIGLDSFLITTYGSTNGGGSPLDVAVVTLNVTATGPNTVVATAGALLLVNSTADGSGGSYSCAAGSTTCTLREAVAEASTTAGAVSTIMFASSVNSVTVASPITIGSGGNQNIMLLGPGATATASGMGAPTQSTFLTISGGGASQIFLVDAGSTFAVDGLTLANGDSQDNYGGAIENDGALSIVNTIFSNNTAVQYAYGGAVDDEGSAATSIVASTFKGNVAYYGGAYYSDGAGATFGHCLFDSNSAFYSDYGEGGAIDSNVNLSVDSSSFTNNVVGSRNTGYAEGYGGAIASWGGTQGTSITNSTFGGSSASMGNYAGGPDDYSYGYGGAVYDETGYVLTLSNDTFSNNKVQGGDDYSSGGAVYADYGVTASGDTWTNNVADPSTYYGGYGGALYANDTATLTNESFTGNSALGGVYGESYGGAVYSYDIIGTNLTFTNNVVSTVGGDGYEADGGGLYSDDEATLTNVTFSGNTASGIGYYDYAYGGGAYLDSVISLSNVTFTNNTAIAYYEALGGGLYQDPPPLNSPAAAHLYVNRGAHSTLIASLTQRDKFRAAIAATRNAHTRRYTIRPNPKAKHTKHAAQTSGIATVQSQRRYAQSGPTTWSNLTFTGNTATATKDEYCYGGGMYFDDYAIVTGTFTNNICNSTQTGAYGYGGAIYNDYDLTFTGTMTGNSALTNGGGIDNEDTLTLVNSTISGNSVTAVQESYQGGGGIFNDSTMTLDKSTVSGNSVAGTIAGSGGGGVFNYSSMTITNSTIFQNTSSQNGGGIENQSSLSIVNATIFGNTATVNGGSIDNISSLTLRNSIVAGGTAPTGPEINNTSSLTSSDYNLVQGTSVGFTAAAHDKTGVSPGLASSLASNGGLTQTLADTSSSPGRAYIPYSGGCGGSGLTVDQRGYTRGAGAVCDIGAFEFLGVAP